MDRTIRIHAFAILVATMVLLGSTAASADGEELEFPSHKQGYYISVIGMGALDFHTTSDGLRGPWGGPGFRFRMGEALLDWLDVGIYGGANWGLAGNYTTVHGNFGIEATLKPTDYLFVQIGAGLGFTDFTRQQNGIDPIIGRFGGEYIVSVGYDFFPGQKEPYQSGGVSVTPVLGVMIGPANPTGTYTPFVGVALTWWSGLPKRKLNLPVEQAY